jgi:hypothetical protein
MKDRMHVPDCDVHSDWICDWNVMLVAATQQSHGRDVV